MRCRTFRGIIDAELGSCQFLAIVNQSPTLKNEQDINLSRVHIYLLIGCNKHWKQLVLLSDYTNQHILSTFKRFGSSISVYAQFCRCVPMGSASMCNATVRSKLVFQIVPCQSHLTQGDDQIKYFIDIVLKHIVILNQKHTIISIPLYFEFFVLRKIFIKREKDNVDKGIGFFSVTEYSKAS